ncbi:MAG: 3'-5' exonuclease [Myxococcota bacterium]
MGPSLRRWWSRRRMLGHPGEEALARYARECVPIAGKTPWRNARFVVFDTEATGLDLVADRLLSIAGVATRGDVVVLADSFEVILAGEEVGAQAAPVHGLVPKDLAEGLEEAQAVDAFLAYAGAAVLVAHHAAFDVAMLDRSLGARGGRLLNPVLDTEHLARRLAGGSSPGVLARQPRQSLDALAERFGLATEARHTAAGDALLTALVLQRLLQDAERRGIRTVGELVR